MIQNTSNKPLSELFSADNSVTYHIPKYQREYIWSKWNWEALFDDIEESDGGHFMGFSSCDIWGGNNVNTAEHRRLN